MMKKWGKKSLPQQDEDVHEKKYLEQQYRGLLTLIEKLQRGAKIAVKYC